MKFFEIHLFIYFYLIAGYIVVACKCLIKGGTRSPFESRIIRL
jgi:hypothetical protein